MKKVVLIKIFVPIAVIIAACAGYWLISPLFINKEVQESFESLKSRETPQKSATETAGPETIKSGAFAGFDNLHKASGNASLIKLGDRHYVRFEENFMVTNGPDLFVYFGKNGKYAPEARLGKLKGNIGSQNYEVPKEVNPEDYDEVWVWCRAFSVPFGKAKFDIK